MQPLQLDHVKLHGFRLLARPSHQGESVKLNNQAIAIAAKIGAKVGLKGPGPGPGQN